MVDLATDIAHQIGFLTGMVLYAVLLAMVLAKSVSVSAEGGTTRRWHERLPIPLAIAVLGLLWNLAGLASGLVPAHTPVVTPALLSFVAVSTLSGLPALALHSVWQAAVGEMRRLLGLVVLGGYGLSVATLLWNGWALASGDPVPDPDAWRMLTGGFLFLFCALLVIMKQALTGHSGLVLVLLAVCSVAALPISHHSTDGLPWWLDFLGHHASLPIAVAVLYRDYRFAFVDRFISKALSFLSLVSVTVGCHVLLVAVAPWVDGGTTPRFSPVISALMISLWVATALGYPWLERKVTWLIDRFILERPDYQGLRRRLGSRLDELDTVEAVLGELCQTLQQALRSREVQWEQVATIPSLPRLAEGHCKTDGGQKRAPVEQEIPILTTQGSLMMIVPTWESPRYRVIVAAREDGHRFLSEELTLVEEAALLAARRIDVLRTSHERCEIALREQEMQKLATEAELRALRAQVNPHFLFNALNTVGYLIDTAPARAAATLRDLTYLLRNILRRMEDNFTTLGEELDLVRAYLDIERARFEERLSVQIEVPRELHRTTVPALVLQPLVENAVKHGIQPSMRGGAIRITAWLTPQSAMQGCPRLSPQLLCLEIADTGVGASEEALKRGRERGIGLSNVENRLRCLYGAWASLRIVSTSGVGTTVTVQLPVDEPAVPSVSSTSVAVGRGVA
ncbi:sensor histidine kinase [Candidatus Nitrospira inopinata]|uniref:histidine kinase n=1 Tax=Candidatus Nitrospira inopinata TaxID=1715989 RepID=A0A0S4KU36_9BACT|nr:histidine kinase [Candidatus Nitrospira inopinata]CUQ67311.1 putative Histidine kinase [Candidatus Nitrospira inopinata]